MKKVRRAGTPHPANRQYSQATHQRRGDTGQLRGQLFRQAYTAPPQPAPTYQATALPAKPATKVTCNPLMGLEVVMPVAL